MSTPKRTPLFSVPLQALPGTWGEARRWVHHTLARLGVADPVREGDFLLSHALGCDVVTLLTSPRRPLTGEEGARLLPLLERRGRREPLPYILGEWEFFGIPLKVTPAVMVPRPETETLVEEALRWARGREGPLRIADIGTGSGCIAIALALSLPGARVYATDISWEALEVARENCRRNGAEGQVVLLQGDLLSPLPGPVDLLVANLPYIPEGEVSSLEPEVSLYEPRLALCGGPDGTALLRRLLREAPSRLTRGGALFLETDPRHRPALEEEARTLFPSARLWWARDLGGWDRVLALALRP